MDPEAQLDLMSPPVSSTPDIVTPDKEDYKPRGNAGNKIRPHLMGLSSQDGGLGPRC